MKPILEINEIAKQYRISHQAGGYLSFRERLTNVFTRSASTREEFWALKDVSFNVREGESIGIIGKNGAGKSTLLKILSKITPPTKGKIIERGRIASLLEVGTGFHPELTGRENIFFNGSLLGMKKKEIEKNFDEIIDFSGTEKFLDTPLKHYSSGMQLRLAFAVAAFLEPEILVIDEVLAVGDAEFQKKCLGKMEAVSKSGRTILFVSHNMAAVQSLCNRAIVLDKGAVVKDGSISDAILYYQQISPASKNIEVASHKPLYISDISVESVGGTALTLSSTVFKVEVTSSVTHNNVLIGFGINDVSGGRLFTLYSKFRDRKYKVSPGKNYFEASVDSLPLKPDLYMVEVYVGDGTTTYDYYDKGFSFEVTSPESIPYNFLPDKTQGSVVVDQKWS